MAENIKNENTEYPYLHEGVDEAKSSRFAWMKTRAVKTSAIVAAGALALGAAFAVGATVGKNVGPGPEGQFGNHAPFDRDGDHQQPKGGFPGGPKGPHADDDGDRGLGDDGFQLPADPNAPAVPPTNPNGSTVNP